MTLPTNDTLRGSGSPDRETRRELAKLTATFLNGLAVAVIAVGGLAPAVAYFISLQLETSSLALAVMSPILILAGIALHAAARRVLRLGFER